MNSVEVRIKEDEDAEFYEFTIHSEGGEDFQREVSREQLASIMNLRMVATTSLIDKDKLHILLPHRRSDIQPISIKTTQEDVMALAQSASILINAHQHDPRIWERFEGVAVGRDAEDTPYSNMIPRVTT